jgi:chitin synthase
VQHKLYKFYKFVCNYVYVGPMVWYQKFEYAIGHWLQKATEHVIGCVLCSPGCFSLFRGEALMDDAVMNKYTAVSTEAKHFVQYDQGKTEQHLSSPVFF